MREVSVDQVESRETGRGTYRRLVRMKMLILLLMFFVLVLSVLVDIALGPANYRLAEVVMALFHPDGVSRQVQVVVWEIRLPIALMAVAVGAALSVSGAQMQTILNNPLASPFTLGVSAAASFGAALGLAFGLRVLPVVSDYIVPINALLMAMLSAGLIHLLSIRRGVTSETIVLFGISLVFSFNALLALAQYFASEQAVAAVVFWTMGSLTKATWEKLGVVVLVMCCVIPVFVRHAWALTALRLGDDKAASFGVNVARVRLQTLLLVSILSSFPVAFVGTIGFVGLVGPHVARMIIGEDQRFFMPAAMLSGAVMLSVSSVVSKTLIPGAIFPIGVVTSLVGVSFFTFLILNRRNRSW